MNGKLSISTLVSSVLLFGVVIGFSAARTQQLGPSHANTIKCQIYSPGGGKCFGAYR